MQKSTKIIIGIILVVLGTVWGLNSLGITNIDLFFDGWWTLIWIIPCTVGLFKDKDKTGDIIGIVIGIVLLLHAWEIINLKLLWKLILPAAVILIGLALIFKDNFNKKTKEAINALNEKKTTSNSENAFFSSLNKDYENMPFEGVELNAVFGGIKLDLRNSVINEDTVINASAIFGGIDILVPDDVNVKISSTSIFGGVSDKRAQKCKNGTHTVYINALCLFGGVDIK